MTKATKKQVELLKKYGISNYAIEKNKITINGSLDLSSLTSADKDFLKGTTINGSLYLSSLTSADKDFLKGTTINGSLYLSSLTSADKDFLKGTTINGYLYLSSLTSADKDFLKGTTINGSLDLSSLTSADKDFLKGTTINGSLDLSSLTSADKDFLKGNVKMLKTGYNKKGGYCFFDNILSKVITVSEKRGYTVFTTPSSFVVKKGRFTAHGKTVKDAIKDLEFKIIAEKIKKTPIKSDTIIDMSYYRTITGACKEGMQLWCANNNMTKKSYRASELLPILEKTRAYGVERFKQLITF